MKIWGQLTTVNLYDFDAQLLKNKSELRRFPLELCKKIKMKPFGNPIIKRFGKGELEGYSMMQFIETSSITVHIDETDIRIFIDIFSCKKFDSQAAVNFSKSFFKAKKVNYKTIYRQ